MRAFGTSVVVLNTLEASNALFAKPEYADRPILTMAGDMMGLAQVNTYNLLFASKI